MNDPSSPNPSPRAFIAAPDPRRYFPAAVTEEARQKISRAIERGEGPVLVIGAAGTGKTLLLEVLAEQFRAQRVIVSLPGAQLCSRRALLQMMLFQIGLPFRGLDEGELRVSLLGHLQPQDGPPRRMLLLVDEADSLPARLLEELRVLTNVADEGQLQVSLILAGSAALEERFAEPKMEVFSQRISTRCYLAALGREETFQYVRAQVASVGGKPDQLFAPDGLEAIFAATDGVPRLLNQLGDQLLWTVEETGVGPLDGTIVQQAWSELQQLPAPWNTPAASTHASAVELGEFSTDDEDPLETIYEDEIEDDLPASIPISFSQMSESHGNAHQYAETFDATDHVKEQLDQLDSTKIESASPQASSTPLSRNPFEEVFDSEEVVLDRYLEFEGQILASAPRVLNRIDTAFAQQLREYEVAELHAALESHNEEVSAQLAVATREMVAETEDRPAEALRAVEETAEEAIVPAEISALDSPRELLVVEDENRPNVAVVPGQKFRQLFSSLESGGSASCLG